MSTRVRSKRTASCLKKSSVMRSRWVRITFGGATLRTEGRPPSWDAHGIDQAPRAAASVMLTSLSIAIPLQALFKISMPLRPALLDKTDGVVVGDANSRLVGRSVSYFL